VDTVIPCGAGIQACSLERTLQATIAAKISAQISSALPGSGTGADGGPGPGPGAEPQVTVPAFPQVLTGTSGEPIGRYPLPRGDSAPAPVDPGGNAAGPHPVELGLVSNAE
jgi:hypothetical protein